MDGLESIIEQLEAQKAAIDKALEALHEVGGSASVVTATKDAISKRSLAQKARWAAVKAGERAKKSGGMTPAGRKRLADNMRKRWAAKRTAAQATKRGRKAA